MVKCSVLLYILKKSPIYPIVDEESNKNTLILYHIYLKKKKKQTHKNTYLLLNLSNNFVIDYNGTSSSPATISSVPVSGTVSVISATAFLVITC